MHRALKLLPIAVLAAASLASAATDAVRVTLRESATAVGRVTLGDVARVEGDLDPVLLTRGIAVGENGHVELTTVLRALGDAGIRADRLLVQGPASCDVTVLEAEAPAESFDDEWGTLAAARSTHVAPTASASASATSTLIRDRLAAAVALPAESVTVSPQSPLPATALRVDPIGEASLGSSTWRVTLADGTTQSVRLEASAQIESARVVRPVSRGQIVRPEDLEAVSRTVTRADSAGVTLASAVGQRAARDLHPGGMLARRDLSAPLLVKRGQYLTVTLSRGGIVVRTLAKAEADGGFGEVVRCRIDKTGETLGVVVTGPQAGSVAP